MQTELQSRVRSTFESLFLQSPDYITIAPGRINLIGEHTDYSDGFVLPVAIDRTVTIAHSPREDGLLHVFSLDFDDELMVNLGDLKRNYGGWKDYVIGMAWAMMESGLKISGWQGIVAGNIPIGAGLSSSAALEVASGKTFCISSDLNLSATDLAKISRKAEIDWVGVKVGIMDQLISAAAKKDHALLLDCRNLDYEYVAIPNQARLIVLDTMTRRELTSSNYNARHEEVRDSAKILGIGQLRDATPPLIQLNKNNLNPTQYRRIKHVVSENERVKQFVTAMRNNDLFTMGNLINKSHISLRDDFEVSSDELNLIVNIAQRQPGCVGARMMGAGFGGCALALLNNGDVHDFTQTIAKTYHAETGVKPNIFEVFSTHGVNSYSVTEKKTNNN